MPHSHFGVKQGLDFTYACVSWNVQKHFTWVFFPLKNNSLLESCASFKLLGPLEVVGQEKRTVGLSVVQETFTTRRSGGLCVTRSTRPWSSQVGRETDKHANNKRRRCFSSDSHRGDKESVMAWWGQRVGRLLSLGEGAAGKASLRRKYLSQDITVKRDTDHVKIWGGEHHRQKGAADAKVLRQAQR